MTSTLSPRVVVIRLPSEWSRQPPFVWSCIDSFLASNADGSFGSDAGDAGSMVWAAGRFGALAPPMRSRVSSAKPWTQPARSSPVARGCVMSPAFGAATPRRRYDPIAFLASPDAAPAPVKSGTDSSRNLPAIVSFSRTSL
jgi:hypothetical protein